MERELNRLASLLGILIILGTCYALSRHRKVIRWRIVGWGLGLQFLIAMFVLRTGAGYRLLDKASRGVVWFLHFSFEGSKFVFGPLGDPKGNLGMIFAFQALPLIIYVAAFFSVLYYLRVLPALVSLAAKVMFKLMGTSGAESLEVAASVVMGQTEAPLVIRPYLETLTESEMMTVMTAGMAHIAGSVLGAYILFGAQARDLLTAVVMTAPGTMLVSKMLIPETGQPQTAGEVNLTAEKKYVNVLDAVSHGVMDGLFIALNVGAMLIAFVALIALANGFLAFGHTNLHTVFGYLLAPVAWLLGVPWHDAMAVGNLLATKVILNEFVAFSMLGPLKGHIAARSFTIATYALCGFANFASIGIQIGGIGALVPSRRQDLARLGFWALLGGTLANYLSAAIVGLFIR
ncbi:MAG TPA: nucleoside transporter C-terminal domain-containing protein [Terriglobia bacterium]|nr:nucleoside transporter C-terminal domain-containing protein [Terriglobia bacterium]